MPHWPKLTPEGRDVLLREIRKENPQLLPTKVLASVLNVVDRQAANILAERSPAVITGPNQEKLLSKLAGLPRGFFAPDAGFVSWESEAAPSGQGQPQDLLSQILTTQSAKVGFLIYPPLIDWKGEQSTPPTGFYGNLLRIVAEKHKLQLKYKALMVCNAVKAVQSGQVDFVLSIFETPERRGVDFCAFMHSIEVGIVTRKSDGRIRNEADLSKDGLRIVVAEGEIGWEIARKKNLLDSTQVRVRTLQNEEIGAVVDLVATGRFDAAIADSISCAVAIRELQRRRIPDIQLLPKSVFTCHNGCMIAQNQARLAKWLTQEINEARSTPENVLADRKLEAEFKGLLRRF